MVHDHHIYGYSEKHKDDVVPYCQSCDIKAHYKARKEGRCTLNGKESNRLSTRSYQRRSYKKKQLSGKTLMPYVRLFEQIRFNINTNTININSYFGTGTSKKLKYIDI